MTKDKKNIIRFEDHNGGLSDKEHLIDIGEFQTLNESLAGENYEPTDWPTNMIDTFNPVPPYIHTDEETEKIFMRDWAVYERYNRMWNKRFLKRVLSVISALGSILVFSLFFEVLFLIWTRSELALNILLTTFISAGFLYLLDKATTQTLNKQ